MRIGELAKQSGVGIETVRFYEKKGLIKQPLRPKIGGYRDYPTNVVRRIRFIRSAKQLGFSLAEVVDLLELEAGNATRCVDVRQRAEVKREEVQTKIDNLNRIDHALELLIEACPGSGSARSCSILEAIHSGELQLNPARKGETNGQK